MISGRCGIIQLWRSGIGAPRRLVPCCPPPPPSALPPPLVSDAQADTVVWVLPRALLDLFTRTHTHWHTYTTHTHTHTHTHTIVEAGRGRTDYSVAGEEVTKRAATQWTGFRHVCHHTWPPGDKTQWRAVVTKHAATVGYGLNPSTLRNPTDSNSVASEHRWWWWVDA